MHSPLRSEAVGSVCRRTARRNLQGGDSNASPETLSVASSPHCPPLTLLVFSARLTWTQERPSASKTPTQLSNLAAQFVAVPEGKIRFHPVYENLSLPFAPNQGQTPSQMRFRSYDIGYHPSPTRNNALPELWQLAKTAEPQVKANHFIGNTPTEWLTHNGVHFRTPDPGGDVPYYGHRIPWAGRLILDIGEQAKFHPRVTRVLEVIEPGFGVGKPSSPPVDRQVTPMSSGGAHSASWVAPLSTFDQPRQLLTGRIGLSRTRVVRSGEPVRREHPQRSSILGDVNLERRFMPTS